MNSEFPMRICLWMLTDAPVISGGSPWQVLGGPARGGSPSRNAGLFSQLFGGKLLIGHLSIL